MFTARGIQGTRVLQGVLALTSKHSSEALEKACEIALSHGCYALRSLRKLVGRQEDRPSLGEGFSRHDWAKAGLGLAPEKSLAASPMPTGSAELLPPRSSYP